MPAAKRAPLTEDGIDAQTLPHNLDAERALLGAAIINNEVLDVVADVLVPEDFYRDAHRRIWIAMQAMHGLNVSIDYVTLREELMRRGDLGECGGPAYVAGLTDGVPRGVNAPYYAGIVKEKAMLRGLIFASHATLQDAYAGTDSASELLARADDRLLKLAVGGARSERVTLMKHSVTTLMHDLDERMKVKGTLTGIDTGWKSVNEIGYGWQRGELVIVAARPSIGKTIFTQNTLAHAAVSGARCGMFSLEMRRSDLDKRFLAALAGVDIDRIRSGYLGSVDYSRLAAAFEVMAPLPLWIDDRTGHTVSSIRSVCRRKKTESGLDLVVIDYMQLLKPTHDLKKANRTEQLGEVSRLLKLMADDLNLVVIGVSQLSRAGDKRSDPKPRLSDLRESGNLEQDGDTIVMLHRENHRTGGPTEVTFEKQRNGPTGSVLLSLVREFARFTDEGHAPVPPTQAPLPVYEAKPPRTYRRSG